MNTTDRRVRKTQKALETALAELMLQKDKAFFWRQVVTDTK